MSNSNEFMQSKKVTEDVAADPVELSESKKEDIVLNHLEDLNKIILFT